MPLQKSHQEVENLPVKHQIVLIAENIRTPENMGMIFRVAEAFGVQEIVFAGSHGIELSTKAKRASRSTFDKIDHAFAADITEVLTALQAEGFHNIALEVTKDSQPIQQFDFSRHAKIALIIGSERKGISEDALKIIPDSVHIPLYGNNSSINVVSALAIALQEINR